MDGYTKKTKVMPKSMCNNCLGCGWQKRIDKFICFNKNCIGTCHLCQNVNKTDWIDCTICFGKGLILTPKKSNV